MEWRSMIIAVLEQEYYIHRPSSFFKCERMVMITHYQMEVFPKRTNRRGEAFFDLRGESSSFLTSSHLWRNSQAYSASTYLVLLWHCFFFLSLRKVSVLKLILWKLSLDFVTKRRCLHSGELRTETVSSDLKGKKTSLLEENVLIFPFLNCSWRMAGFLPQNRRMCQFFPFQSVCSPVLPPVSLLGILPSEISLFSAVTPLSRVLWDWTIAMPDRWAGRNNTQCKNLH